MRRIIYLYNNYHINKITISFIIISTLLLILSVDSSIDINLYNLEDLRNYNAFKEIFISDIYNLFEIVISMFVIILSFMELYSNSHLFDVVLISYHKKNKVLLAKLISYLSIIFTYITIIFAATTLVAIIKFQDIYIISDVIVVYVYTLIVNAMILLVSILLLTLFKNYFSSFILLLFIILKRIFLETNSKFFINILPYLNLNDLKMSLSITLIIIYFIILILINFIVFKFKDIKT